MKNLLLLPALISLFLVAGCSNQETIQYRDGGYRGAYLDGAPEIAFELKNNKFVELSYRKLSYKDTDFLSEDAPQNVKDIASQYQSLLDYLVGKDVSEIEALYTPAKIAKDTPDGMSGATIRSGKVISALNDALIHDAYSLPKK